MTLTPQQFMPLPAGAELDRAVRRRVLGSDSKGKAPAYSTSAEHAFSLLNSLPICVGRYAQNSEGWTEARPYFAAFEAGPPGGKQTFRVTAQTPQLALCKAALLYAYETSED